MLTTGGSGIVKIVIVGSILVIWFELSGLFEDKKVPFKTPKPLNEHENIIQQVKAVARHRYLQRINRVRNYCLHHQNDSILQEINGHSKWNQDLWYDYNHQLLYCQINKVGSSTWMNHLFKLNDIDITSYKKNVLRAENLQTKEYRPRMRQDFFALQNSTFIEAKSSLLSFVFVREPFARLVSAYYDKIYVDYAKKKTFMKLRNTIFRLFRNVSLDSISKHEAPTPEEFVKYLLHLKDTVHPLQFDNHYKPMWAICPFCSVDFDVIGNLEDFDQDTAFIAFINGLSDRLDVNLHKNLKAADDEKESKMDKFFNGIPKNIVRKLYEFCKRDYEMFGYPPPHKYMY